MLTGVGGEDITSQHSTMIKCLLANNDSVMDTSLSESVLELEYLEQKVVTIISLAHIPLYLL